MSDTADDHGTEPAQRSFPDFDTGELVRVGPVDVPHLPSNSGITCILCDEWITEFTNSVLDQHGYGKCVAGEVCSTCKGAGQIEEVWLNRHGKIVMTQTWTCP